MALLAFEEPSSSPLGALLGGAQRQKTAGELNAAVLAAQGQEREARAPMLLKAMLWAQARARALAPCAAAAAQRSAGRGRGGAASSRPSRRPP